MIRAVKFVGVPVSDQDRALAFYTGKLGFAVATDQPMGEGKRWIELRIPGAETKLVLFTPEGQEDRIGSFMNMAFYADDVQRTYEELLARGVEFTQPARVEPWGASAIFKDPDGNTFVIGLK
jgi:catechol 2,3-dioxygenase-like lactoylglutathione lyase family enzyme